MKAYSTLVLGSLVGASLMSTGSAMGQLVTGYTVFNSISGGVNGELRLPPGYDSSKSYPLVVFFHGAGEIGSDNTKQINGNMANLAANADSRGFLLYCPQTSRPTWGVTDDLIAVTQNIGRMTTLYNIDPNRIYATGLSLGGQATDISLTQWPNLYAGYVPLSAYDQPHILTAGTEAAKAVGKPVWFYHGNADGTVGVADTRTSVNNILAAQGQPALTSWASSSVPTFNFSYNNLHYTEYNGKGHDNNVWNNGAYNDANMYNWLLAQKNSNGPLAPGKSLNVDFTAWVGVPTAKDSQNRMWNHAGAGQNTGYNDPRTLDNIVGFALDSTGTQTTVQLQVTKSFFGGDDPLIPTAQRSLSTAYDSFVTSSNWRVTSAQGQLTFSGLTPGALYNLAVFASINDTDGTRRYFGTYAVGATSVTFDASNNLTDMINLANVAADSGGKLVLNITPTNGSRYAVMSGLTLSAAAVPEPATLGLLASGAGWLMMRRRREARFPPRMAR